MTCLSTKLRTKYYPYITKFPTPSQLSLIQQAILHKHLYIQHQGNMPYYSSSSDSDDQQPRTKTLFGRRRPLHDILGGEKVADIVLWRNKHLSGGILALVTVIWLLFEVVEYHFLTLLCHISITAMLVVFIWSNGAAVLDLPPPKIPEVILSEEAFREVALVFHGKLSSFLSFLHYIARGKDLKLFLLAIASLWILSVIGSYCDSLSLLYLGFLCFLTLPALYEHYESDVDRLAYKGTHDLKKLYRKFDRKVLNRIPRRPVKEKKF